MKLRPQTLTELSDYEQEIYLPNTVLHKAETRGHDHYDWLESWHSFSFANYFDPERQNFGSIRVLNEDTVSPGAGFGTHPHQNMEIISIPLSGDLKHKDNMGNIGTIKEGEIQVMSAGTGIFHSEFNANADKDVQFLQIWVTPNQRNVAPRYDQMSFNPADRKNKLQQIITPNADEPGLWIHQDSWFYRSDLDAGQALPYHLKKNNHGVYIFLLEGQLEANGVTLNKRDGFGTWNTDELQLKALRRSELLIMEVNMHP